MRCGCAPLYVVLYVPVCVVHRSEKGLQKCVIMFSGGVMFFWQAGPKRKAGVTRIPKSKRCPLAIARVYAPMA